MTIRRQGVWTRLGVKGWGNVAENILEGDVEIRKLGGAAAEKVEILSRNI